MSRSAAWDANEACAKAALELGFQYASTCARLRHDEFGGGAVVITQAGIRYHSTSDILLDGLDDRACTRLIVEIVSSNEFAGRDDQL